MLPSPRCAKPHFYTQLGNPKQRGRLEPARRRGGLPPPKGGFRYRENFRLSPRAQPRMEFLD